LILQAAPDVADKQLIRTLDPQQWQQVWAAVGANTAQARETIRLGEIETRTIDDAIVEKARAQSQPVVEPTPPPSMVVRVNLDAPAATTARLRLTYQLAGASWRPVYDAHLDTDRGKVRLTQFAEVRQHTSEDWSQAALTLSNLRPSAGAVLPDLSPWLVP